MYTPKVKSSRQQAKEKAKALKELYFLVQWEDRDEEDGHNILPAKAIVVDNDADLEALGEGDNCQALFNKKMYPATIVGSGTYQKMKTTQEEMDTSGHRYARESSDIFEVAEDDMDITEAAVPEDVVEMSGVQLDDYKDDVSGKVAGSIGTPKKGGVKKGRPKAAKSPKPVKPPKGAKSPKLAAKSPKKKKTTKKLLTKSPPKKKSKREMGTEKARRIESDRISSLILASVGDFSETKGKKSTSVSSLAEAGPSTVAESPSAVVKSPSSCATPIAASSVIGSSPQSIECSERELDSDSFSYSGSYYDYETPAASPPAAKPVQYTPPSYGPPSTAPYPGMYPPYQQPPYGQQRPYMLSHTYSWPSSSEGVAAQVAEMKSLLVSSLGDMKMEIHNLKSDVYAKKKRKRSREHSLASSDVSDQEVAPTPKGLILGDPKGKFIHIDHPTVKPSDICAVEVLSKAASKCALALLDVFFSKECLARSLATKKEDKDLLDPDIIEGIRLHINYKYPCTTPEEERGGEVERES